MIYLGGHLRKAQLENGVDAWAFSSSQYVQAAVKNVEDWLTKDEKKKRWKLPRKAETLLISTYKPELDVSPALNSQEAAYYQSLIEIS
jgi:phage portal protein BeeE